MPNAVAKVRERPILFSAPMVRAIQDGRKTQTRRVVKPQPVDAVYHRSDAPGIWYVDGSACHAYPNARHSWECPYGAPGDWLWGREAWAQREGTKCVAYRADGECGSWASDGAGGWLWLRHGGVVGSGIPPRPESWLGQTFGLSYYGGRWRPSIHMPRWASRLTLQVTDVRVERLQDITIDGARAEGITEYGHEVRGEPWFPGDDAYRNHSSVENYALLWDSINAKRVALGKLEHPDAENLSYPWESNPWVWVVAFSRVDEVAHA